jgi:hypothetical protein
MKRFWQIISGVILVNFILEIGYSFYMVFYAVGGSRYPLMKSAEETPIEVILKRRLYAIEAWVAISGLASYLGLTEVFPRKLRIILAENNIDQS